MNVSEFLPAYLDWCYRHKAPSTVKNFDEPALRAFAQDFPSVNIKKITPANIMFWESCLSQKYGKTTVGMRLKSLRTALNWAVDMGFLKDNPAARVRIVKGEEVGRALHQWEADKLLEHAPEGFVPVIGFTLETGLRRGEIVMLDWAMYDRGRFTLPPAKTKSRRARIIPLSDKAKAWAGQPRLKGSVFGLTKDQINWHFKQAVGRAGIGRVRFHDLRHTWATRRIEEGMDPFTLLMRGGWSSLTSLQPYAHVMREVATHTSTQACLPIKKEDDTLSPIFTELSTFFEELCARGDLNPHVVRHTHLKGASEEEKKED